MSLKEYKQKRNFKETPEPFTSKNKSLPKNKKLKYSIQEHHASHLHWDLRLEHKGVLLSWAIPKSPEELISNKKTKRLAIQTEDHPVEYWDFAGKIPEGNYGAGEVKLWDKGTYELISKDDKKIEIEIHGKKLKGDYVLVKTNYGSKPEKSWLFFKI
jgi:DNA ligase D-like protein (predicted 3'-phosphoesterase)